MAALVDRELKALQAKIIPNSTLHDRLKRLVVSRIDFSKKHISQRYEKFRESENEHLAYVDLAQKDKDSDKKLYPFTRNIVVPYTYAAIQTRVTYFFLALTGKSPIVPISGAGPSDVTPAKFMEVIDEYQISEQSGLSVFFNWLQDAERYGFGVVKNVWHTMRENKVFKKRIPQMVLGTQVGEFFQQVRERVLVYEGNIPFNLSVYNFYPDPRVNISQCRKGEFIGNYFERSHNYLLNRERDGEYFNIDKISRLKDSLTSGASSLDSDKQNNQSNLAKIAGVESQVESFISDTSNSESSDNEDKDIGFHGLEELWITLIPKDYGFSDEQYPEEWIITLADRTTIIKCEPSCYREFPFYVIEPNHDSSSPFNISTPETLRGLSRILSWLFNSHMDNVRKIVNDTLIVDPSMIEMKDLLSGKAVKIIRLKEDFWGVPNAVTQAAHQLTISDITRQHLQDAKIVIDLIQRVSSASDNMMGMVEEVKRTATETSSTINLATSRLKLIAKLYATHGFIPFYRDMSFNNQSMLTKERFYQITDTMLQELGQTDDIVNNRILISPDQLYGDFNFLYPNLDLPTDKTQMAQVWRDLIKELFTNPITAQKFDIMPFVRHLMFNLGVTNISEFMPKITVQPDAQVAANVKKGNLAPMNQIAGLAGVNGNMIDDMKKNFGSDLANYGTVQ